MRVKTLLPICVFSLVLFPISAVNAVEQTVSIKIAIQRSLPYLKEQGKWWLTKKKCSSCHRLTFLPQVLREAKNRGISDESKSLKFWSEQILKSTNTKNNRLGLSQLILGRDKTIKASEKRYDQFASIIIKGQKKDGSWKAEGQLPKQKRPVNESVEVATMWNYLALGTVSTQTEEIEIVRSKARKFIHSKKNGISTEWHSTRLLIELQSDNRDSKSVASRLEQLLEHQNSDGGWGWITGEKSDALATGLVLYVLSQHGLKREKTDIDKAINWLLKTQTKEGNWLVPGTKEKKKNKPQETANYWGTIWATLGLMQYLPSKEVKLSRNSE